jgi:hypothetical protein
VNRSERPGSEVQGNLGLLDGPDVGPVCWRQALEGYEQAAQKAESGHGLVVVVTEVVRGDGVLDSGDSLDAVPSVGCRNVSVG